MYLTIPSKKNIDLLKKLKFGMIEKYDSLNNFNISMFKIPLKDVDGLNDQSLYNYYYEILKDFGNESIYRFSNLWLFADSKEVLEKGKVKETTDSGEVIVEYGTRFEQCTDLSMINVLGFSSDYEDTGIKAPVTIDENGNMFMACVFHHKSLDKKFIVLKANNNQLMNVDISEITPIAIENKDIIICEEKKLEWIIKGESAITLQAPIMAYPSANFDNSKLKQVINSEDFQKGLGLQPTIIKKSANPFKVANNPTLDFQVKKALNIGVIPFLVGAPGVGKTQVIMSQSKHVIHNNMATWNPVSFTGKDYVIPGDVVTYEENGRTITRNENALTGRTKPEWLQNVEHALEESKIDGEDVILFLDEFDKLSPSMQVMINGIVDNEPTLGGWKIPKGVKIVLAGNTSADSLASNKISSEVATRLMTINVVPNIKEWIKWAVNSNVDPIVISYLATNPNDLLTTVYGSDGRNDPNKSMNPRSWVNKVSSELKCSRETGLPLMIDNYMSEEQIDKFMKFIEQYYENSIEDILSGNAPLYITDSIDKNTFQTTILSVITNIAQLKNVLNYIKNGEFRKFFLNNWIQYHPNEKMKAYEIIQELELESEVKSNGFKK